MAGTSGTFDPSSGTLTTDDGEQIGPGLTRTEFLASPLAATAEPLSINEPHASWRVARSFGRRPFQLGLFFEADRLQVVVLAQEDALFGSSWTDWSLEREMARKAAHEAWLATFDPAIGHSHGYDWGSVQSIYDDRSAGSQIVLNYQFSGGGPRGS
jgi:hypothetical protein